MHRYATALLLCLALGLSVALASPEPISEAERQAAFSRLDEIRDEVRAAGIPCDDCKVGPDWKPVLFLGPGATAAQRTQAARIMAEVLARKPRVVLSVVDALAILSLDPTDAPARAVVQAHVSSRAR